MHFLYPKVLWGLLALALPIIIHLFNFRKYTTVYFSNVAFLQNIRKESKSRSNLKNILVLICRLLAVFFIVVAFSKPYIPKGENDKIEINKHVVIYIDNSFSMDAEGKYGILLEAAKLKAKEISASLPVGAKYLLLTNDFSLKHQRFVGRDQFVEWVSQVQSSHQARTLNEVFDKASILMPSSEITNKLQVYLISDYQENLFRDFRKFDTERMAVFALPLTNNQTGNLFIDSVWFSTPDHYKGKPEELHVLIKNTSEQDYTDIPLTLHINDTLEASVVFNIEAEKSIEVVVPFAIWNAGWIKAKVHINDYPITFDNTLYFDFEVSDKKAVLIVNNSMNTNDDYFSALYKNDRNIHATTVDQNNIPYNSFQKYEVIIINQLNNLQTGLVSEIIEYTESGGTLVFIPSSSFNRESYNLLLQKLGQFSYGELVDQQGTISGIDMESRLFQSAVHKANDDLRYPQYKSLYEINRISRSKIEVLLRTESDMPAFASFSYGKGEFYFSTISINSETTDFGTHPLFVPLFYNIALYSVQLNNPFNWINPDLITRFKYKGLVVESPSLINIEEEIYLKPKFNYSNQSISFYPLIKELKAGHYNVEIASKFAGCVSYNYDRIESITNYFAENQIVDLFESVASANIEVIDAKNENFKAEIQGLANGKTLSQLFVLLAGLALLLEMVLIRFR